MWGKTIVSSLPCIARARGYHLYDHNGKRYLDLWQNGGFNLLGHREANITRVMKNVISRGQIFDMPSVYEKRLITALEKKFPQYPHFRVFNSWREGLHNLSSLFKRKISPEMIDDPAIEMKGGGVAFWRPFMELSQDVDVIIPIIPFNVGGGPIVFGFKTSNILKNSTISPFILAGALRSLYDINKYTFPSLNLTAVINKNKWQIKGIYIRSLESEEEYEKTYNRFLTEGVLISPDRNVPSILPGESSAGEQKKLKDLFN